jgi:hypothetical protein
MQAQSLIGEKAARQGAIGAVAEYLPQAGEFGRKLALDLIG